MERIFGFGGQRLERNVNVAAIFYFSVAHRGSSSLRSAIYRCICAESGRKRVVALSSVSICGEE